MTQYTTIRLVQDGQIARLTFNRPEALNALSPTLIDEATAATEAVGGTDARVLVLAGEGRAFSAGVDLKAAAGFDRDGARRFTEQARKLIDLLETIPQAVIARVDGFCFTGGLEVALACDFIIASEGSQFADTHAKLGMKSGWGMTQRLPRRVGWMRAKEMSYTARRISAHEAVRIGLILEAVPAAELDARIEAIAAEIIANSAGSVAAYKTLYRAAQNTGLDAGLEYDANVRIKIADNRERQTGFTAGLGKR